MDVNEARAKSKAINGAISGSMTATDRAKVVRKKKVQKSNLHSFIQFDVVPSPHCTSQGNNDTTPHSEYDDECYDQLSKYDDLLIEGDCPVTVGNMKRGGKTVRSTSCNKKLKIHRDNRLKLVRVHDESKQKRRAERIKENHAHQKSNIEEVLSKNSIKRFGHDIYSRRSTLSQQPVRAKINQSPYSYRAKDDLPAVKKHELKSNNIPKELGFLSQIVDLQHRELTPEDYELLLLLDDTVASKTVDPKLLKSINEVSASLAQLVGELCSICMDSYEAEQNTKTLHCKHHFHSQCIDQWLLNSSLKCPLDGLPAFSSLH